MALEVLENHGELFTHFKGVRADLYRGFGVPQSYNS